MSQNEFDSAGHELKRAQSADGSRRAEAPTGSKQPWPIRTIIVLSVVLPIFALTLYLLPEKPVLTERVADAPLPQPAPGRPSKIEMHSVEEMVSRLESRLKIQPDDAQGWLMLARSKLMYERFEEAVGAYRRARTILGEDPHLLADLAETLILAKNGFTDESVELFTRALELNPDLTKALWIGGNFAYQQGNTSLAMQRWQRLLKLLPAGSPQSVNLKNYLAQLNQKAIANNSVDKFLAAAAAEYNIPVLTNNSSIVVSVSLDPVLKSKTSTDDVVFIFARAVQGPRIPLAISRKRVGELPVIVTLDDSLAMTPEFKLSNFSKVLVSARVSKSGEALPSSGDLLGTSSIIEMNRVRSIELVIDKLVP